jgi:subtilisin family serine protease
MDQRWLRILLIAGAALVIVALVLLLVFRSADVIGPQPTPRPTLPPVPVLNITPPPSLAELADDYPELADILTDPELDTCYKEFLVAYQEGGEEAALELAHERGLLTPDNDAIRVTLVLDTMEHEPLVAQLEGVGVTVVSAYQDRVNVSVPVALVEAQLEAEEPGAVFEQLTELDHVIAVRLPEQRAPDQSNIPGEGVRLTDADDWHTAGFTGAGVRIGVLDMGFAGRESLEGTELPAGVPLQTFGWIDEGEVHGTACAEIVHEMAPDAELIFAWYDGSDAAMGEAVDWLMSQGVNIISNSTGGVVGPRDGTGWDARLVDQVASQGVLWVNSSGNEALSHYRAVFRDDDGDNIHEFAPGEESLAVHLGRGGFQIILQWEDSWNAAALDYDLYLYDQDGNLVGASEDYQTGQQGQEPVEGLGGSVDASILYATVVDAGANRDVPFDIFVQGADINYTTPDYSVNTPGDAVGSLTVGAVNFWDDSLAFYSSQGPTADGRLKPEISAPTGVSGATYGERGFDGTSSSCPHVAGAAALIWQANPSFSRDQVIDQLLSNALDLGAAGPDTGYGYGRLRLGSPPQSADMPTVTPALGTVGTPGAPLPTPTPMIYATPLPVASAGGGTEFLAAGALLTLCVGGLGCLGTALVFFGLLGLLVRRRRARRRPAPPPPSPYRQPPRPVPPRDRSPERASRPAPPSPPTRSECPECGEPLRPSARFCPNCGRPVG